MMRTDRSTGARNARLARLGRLPRPSRFAATLVALGGLSLATLASGCGFHSGDESATVGLRAETALPRRAGTLVVDGCVLDTWQKTTLGSPSARRLVSEVVLLCLVPRADGTVGPRDPSALAHLAAVAAELHGLGYRVHFGIAFTDESGQRYDGAQTASYLADTVWRKRFVDSLGPLVASADGIEIDLQFLPNAARELVTSLATEIKIVHPGKRLGVFVPPSVSVPSDLVGGDAFSVGALARVVDRLRIMTLDYSIALVANSDGSSTAVAGAPGPTTDPGWAVDAVRLALASSDKCDVAYPLYGTDFGPRGLRPVTYLDAIARASLAGAPIERGPTGAPFVRYTVGGEAHEIWFDDAESTGRALGAWSHDVLPPNVGVVFYGLGAEDPTLFDRLAERTP